MISGTVSARLEAVIRLRVRGPGGTELDFDAVIDTGFTSSLTLPAGAVTALGLVRQSGGSVLLGDGSVRPFDVYACRGGLGRELAAHSGVGHWRRGTRWDAAPGGAWVAGRGRAGWPGRDQPTPLKHAEPLNGLGSQ